MNYLLITNIVIILTALSFTVKADQVSHSGSTKELSEKHAEFWAKDKCNRQDKEMVENGRRTFPKTTGRTTTRQVGWTTTIYFDCR